MVWFYKYLATNKFQMIEIDVFMNKFCVSFFETLNLDHLQDLEKDVPLEWKTLWMKNYQVSKADQN